MKLLDIQIFPLGKEGWKSDLLQFGDHVTQLYGPNGCGKTPIVQSIAFCLGYPCQFRNDIYNRCSYVVLNILTDKGCLRIKRIFSKDADIEVALPNGDTERYYDEKEYSTFLFGFLDIPISKLVSNNNKVTSPYLATMLPLFYLDQDEGYSDFYSPPSNFIKDQFSEMMRMVFGLPIKNSFDSKKEKLTAKEVLEYLDRQVEDSSRRLKVAIKSTESIPKSSRQLSEEIQSLELEVDQLKNSGATHDDSIRIYDRLIFSHNAAIYELTNEIIDINKRCAGIERIVKEINTEIETLNLNEDARRLFRSFSEICDSENCKLFSVSSESYSKNLLYLKDQIKDLERNAEIDSIRKEELENQKERIKNIIRATVEERNSSLEKSEISALIDTISRIKNQLFELQNQRNEIEKIEKLRASNFDIILKRNDALTMYQSFSKERNILPEVTKLKANLRQHLLIWMEHLHTINISFDITFKDDFIPVFGNENISQLKGSTRIRAVLAYHAAVLELLVTNPKNSFKFLILDTPKQHEIHNNDLDRYVKALKKLCSDKGVQVIFSTTEYHYEGNDQDKEWNPQYLGKEQYMFLNDPVFN